MHRITIVTMPLSMLYLLSILMCLLVIRTDGQPCDQTSPCRCEFSNGGVIDLTSIANTDGTPKFVDVPDTDGTDFFSWNPCVDFTEISCQGVAVCQQRPDIPMAAYYNLGSQASAKFVENDGKLSIQYSAEEQGVLRTSYVALTCSSDSDSLQATGEVGMSAVYNLEYIGPSACKSGGISAGSILLIIFFSGIFLFLLVGIPVQIFIRKETGKRVIPFSEKIFGLPGLAKDGVMFLINKVKGSTYRNV